MGHGSRLLSGLLGGASSVLLAAAASGQDCSGTSVGFVPLSDLADGTYQGAQGGLYPGGQLVRPASHDAAGLVQAASVVPRDALGAPDPGGAIVLLSIGLSNTTQEFSRFIDLVQGDPALNPRLVIVDGAQPGQTAEEIDDPSVPYWSIVDQRLAAAGVTGLQVQAIWLKTANANPSGPFPVYAQGLQGNMTTIVGIVRTRFPNARLAYLSSRIYAGYATTPLNPEPWAYESGFSVKWLIEDQIAGNPALVFDPPGGPPAAPWLSWGPYLWADGTIPRSDGLVWECSDFASDGTHPGAAAREKVARMLDAFFRTDATARTWYLADPGPICGAQARTAKQGTETGGPGGTVQLVASRPPTVPTLGPVIAHAFGAPPFAPGVFLVEHRAPATPGGPLGGAVIGGTTVRRAVTDGNGKASLDLGAIPPDPAACGELWRVRFLVADPGAPGGMQRSRWLWLRAGH